MAQAERPKGKGFGDDRYRALIARLVQARKEAGLSQEGIAKRMGKHQQFVSRYETGERRLDVVEFCDIARLLGLDPAALIASVPA